MKEYNFSRIIKWIEIFLVVVAMLNFVVTIYAIKQLMNNSLSSVSNQFQKDVDGLEQALNGIHSMMLSEIGYDKNLNTLLVAKPYNESVNEVILKSRIKTMISNWSRELPYSVHYVIYFPNNEIEINDCNENDEYILWRSIKGEVLTKIDHLDYKSDWNVMQLNGNKYLVDIIGLDGRYLFAYIDLEEIMKSLESDSYGADYYMALVDSENMIYFNQDRIQEDKIKITAEKEEFSMQRDRIRQILLLRQKISKRNSLYLVIHNYNNMLNIFGIQLILIVLLLSVVFSILIILRLVNKTVLRPIQIFNENVEKIKNDEVYNVETHYQINELGNASQLMSELITRIKGLKIDIYEKTLEQQKTKLDFLTLQIEPHFYLNCLNIIYNMTQVEEYKGIQNLVNCVSEYLRYIFKCRDNFSTVYEELEHVKKYLEIQKIRYGDCFEVHIEMDDKVLRAQMPPLILQTFVENSVKHTINWEDDIELFILGKVEEEVVIIIEDTGDGYDSDILHKLQNGQDISEGQNRIGIMNAISRMKLAYGNEARITFYNRKEGGAGIEIRFPYREEKKDK